MTEHIKEMSNPIFSGVGVGEFDAKETERPQIDTQDIFTDLIR